MPQMVASALHFAAADANGEHMIKVLQKLGAMLLLKINMDIFLDIIWT